MISWKARRLAAQLSVVSLAIVAAPQASRAQRLTERSASRIPARDTGSAHARVVGRCFGTWIDRGCPVMLQYELGYRAPMGGRSPRLLTARPRDRSDRSQLFVAGGLLFPVSERDALGAIYDAGTGDEKGTRSVGVRWAHGFAHDTRIDLTTGATWLPLVGDSVLANRTASANGTFVEAALHGSNLLTLVIRDEAYASRRNADGGNLLFGGARAEAVPAAVLTLIGVAAIGIAVGLTGPNW